MDQKYVVRCVVYNGGRISKSDPGYRPSWLLKKWATEQEYRRRVIGKPLYIGHTIYDGSVSWKGSKVVDVIYNEKDESLSVDVSVKLRPDTAHLFDNLKNNFYYLSTEEAIDKIADRDGVIHSIPALTGVAIVRVPAREGPFVYITLYLRYTNGASAQERTFQWRPILLRNRPSLPRKRSLLFSRA